MKGNTNAGTKASKTKPSKTIAEEKTHYYSFSPREIAKLKESDKDTTQRGKMCLRCWRLYFELKILVDFKTGVVGTFGNQRLSYERLAQMVSIPVTKGSTGATRTIDGKEIKRLLDTLTAEGLVTDVTIENQRLTLRLPLSPVSDDKKKATTVKQAATVTPLEQPTAVPTVAAAAPTAVHGDDDEKEEWDDWFDVEHAELVGNQTTTEAATSPGSSATKGGRLPTDVPAQIEVSACFDKQFGLSDPTLSVMTSIKHQYQFPVLGQAEQSSAPVRAEGTDPFRGGYEGSRSLNAEQIRERMRSQCRDAVWLNTRESATFFKQMAGMEVEADVLDMALAKLNADASAIKSPAALFDALVKEQQAIRRRRANLRTY